MTSRELAKIEKADNIEQKQDEYQSNFFNSSGVNENADASTFVSGTSSGKGQKELQWSPLNRAPSGIAKPALKSGGSIIR